LYRYSKRTLLRIAFYPYSHPQAIRSRILPETSSRLLQMCDFKSATIATCRREKMQVLRHIVHSAGRSLHSPNVCKDGREDVPWVISTLDLSCFVIRNMAGYVPDLTCSSSPARSRTPFCTLPHGMREAVECGWISCFIFAIQLLLEHHEISW
jgi:hypothetical protein